MAEWLKATDCKSVLSRVRRFEPYSAHSTAEASAKAVNDHHSFSEGDLIIQLINKFFKVQPIFACQPP